VTAGFASPERLAALAMLPIFLLRMRGSRRTALAAACRAAAATAIVLALAGLRLQTTRPAAGTCIVAAIDTSASVQDAATDAARRFLAALVPRLGPEDAIGSVAFAAHARVVAHPGAGRDVATLVPARDPADPDAGATRLADALLAAAPLCGDDRPAALLLFTDGNETAGSAAAELAFGGIHPAIFPIVPAAATLPVVGIRRVLAPRLAPEHAVLPLRAVLENRSDRPVSAAIRLTAGGEQAPPFPLDVPPGVSVVELPHRFNGRGEFVVEAALLVTPGEREPPGPVTASVTVTAPLHVVLVTQHDEPALGVALARRGMDVETATPARFSARADALGDTHLVVLDDVGGTAFGAPALAALARWVARGGALVATGGDHLFGDATLARSPLARVLPVELRTDAPEPHEREPLALYLLIDRSNSMGWSSDSPAVGYGDKMEYAKRAALAVLDQLAPDDLVGALAFDSRPYQLGALRRVADSRAELRDRIRALTYGGGTDFKDALETALRELLASGNRTRHVILLTDGDTNRHAADHDDVIAAYARAGVSVTTIRIGSDTVNLELLQHISRATGGEFHHVAHVEALPQLMMRDAARVIDPRAGLEDVAPHVGTTGPMLAGIDEAELPPVTSWAITRARPDADVRLWVDAGDRRDPLLVTWQYGLGRVAALPVDFQSGARAWPAWSGFAKLAAQLALWAAPPALAGERTLEARPLDAATLVRLRTVGDDAGPYALRVDGADVPLRPTAARLFTGLLPHVAPGTHLARLVSRAGDEPVTLVVPPTGTSARELATSGPDRALLERLAAATGGRVDPTLDDVLAAPAGVARRTVPLDGVLIPLALALVLADVALRRLAA